MLDLDQAIRIMPSVLIVFPFGIYHNYFLDMHVCTPIEHFNGSLGRVPRYHELSDWLLIVNPRLSLGPQASREGGQDGPLCIREVEWS